MDIEEALAGLVAALKAGSTFENVIQCDAELSKRTKFAAVNTNLIYLWLYAKCLPKNRVISNSQKSRLEKHMHSVAENLMSAYKLSNTLGCSITTCVEATSASYHAKRRAEDLRNDVASMPKSTIKLLTALPVLSLLAGELLGGHPILILITTIHGWILLAIGATCYSLGLAWVRSMLRISQRTMSNAALRS